MSGKRESLCWGFHTGMESDMVTRKTILIWSLQGEVKQMRKLRIPYGHLKASKTFMTIYYKVIYYTVSRGRYKQGHLLHSHREIHTRPSTTLSVIRVLYTRSTIVIRTLYIQGHYYTAIFGSWTNFYCHFLIETLAPTLKRGGGEIPFTLSPKGKRQPASGRRILETSSKE